MAKKLEELGISTTPWTAKQGYNAYQILCDGGHSILIDDEYGEENEGANLNESNARLISAAPDLYEALIGFVELCESYGCDKKCEDCCCAEQPCILKARAALAKASGEEVAK